MKFWFGQKKEVKPAPEPAAPVEPVVEITPEPTSPPPLSPLGEPPPLGVGKPSAADEPLKPATSLVRPQANQKVLYYQLMNGLYDAVMILDDNGHIVDCNDRVETVLGYSRDEMWDMPVDTVVKGIGPQIFQQMKDALHANHQVLINARCTRKDGEKFQGEVGVCIMHLTRGENLVFTIRNVEKRIANIREQILKEMSAPQHLKPKQPVAVRVISRAKTDGAEAPAADTPVESTSSHEAPAAERPRMVLKRINH